MSMSFCLHNTWDCNGVAFTTSQGGLHRWQYKPGLHFSCVLNMQWSHPDLVSELLWWHMPRWVKKILPSTCKKSVKPASPSSQTLEKSSQIINLLMRLMDHLSIREQTSWYHSYPVVTTTWYFMSSCGHCLALQIMTKPHPTASLPPPHNLP